MEDEERRTLVAPGIDPGEETVVEAPSFSTELSESGSDPRRRECHSKGWLYATVVLCCYGFFKEFKASEAFLTPYLVDYKNFTKIEVRVQQWGQKSQYNYMDSQLGGFLRYACGGEEGSVST